MKPQLITLIKNNCFYGGNPLEDPKQHISIFLRTCGAVNSDGAIHDTYKLLLFPFSLRDEAAQWLETLPQGSIPSWDDLVAKFLAKFSSSQQTIKLKEGIHPFIQGEEEPLFKAWERYKKASDKVGLQAFYEGLTPETRKAVDYFSDGLLKATTTAQRTVSFNNKGVNNQHSFEKPQNAILEKEVMNLEGVKAVMNQNKQLHHQTQQQLELIARKIDCLHSAIVNAQFPPWKPHSYLRMGEYQHQEQRGSNIGKPMITNNQSHPSNNANQNQCLQNMHPQSHNNSQNQQNTFATPTFYPHNTCGIPSQGFPQPLVHLINLNHSQKITNLEILIERMMEHQEVTTKNQEASIKRIERQMEQLAKHLVEMGEKRANTFPRATEDNLKDNEKVATWEKWKATIEGSEKAMGKETIIKEKHHREVPQEEIEERKPTVRGENQRQQNSQLP
ncbi:uncharacterized protein LOC107489540 [Arachis duranensis]|uniref:Uncharacterized protein LOC107489540 n=1 Tax=Arachis duranensis TaxID=130453 RepID=A0A6P4DEP2_ARADU|nr:uncharacterized protein LOC107489540 [Arachis duranensis]